jgi:hypothetical protein
MITDSHKQTDTQEKAESHPLFGMLSDGPPPLFDEILLWTGRAWLLGRCHPSPVDEDILILHDGTGVSHQVSPMDKWLILPNAEIEHPGKQQ